MRKLGAGLILLLSCMPLPAEVVTLEQLIERALQQDHRIAEQQQLVQSAHALLQEAQGSDDVMIDINAYVGLATQLEGGFFASDGTTPRADRYQWNGLSSWTVAQFSIIKPLYTFGKIEHYAAAAKSNIQVKQEDVRKQRGTTIIDASRAYYGYLAARDSRYLFIDVIERLDRSIELVRKWLDTGRGNVRQSDLYALQSGRAIISKYLAQAQAFEAIALAGMKMLLGLEQQQVLEVADQRIMPLALPDSELSELQGEALLKRPEMVQLDAGLQARRSLVAAKKAEKRPNIYAGIAGMAAYTPGRDRLDNPYIYDPFNDYGATPLLGVQWQWASGVNSAHVAREKAELNALLEKAAFAQQGIPFEVEERYQQVQALYEAVQQLRQGSRSARRWMVSAYADFEAGIEDAEAVLTAFQGYVLVYSDFLVTVNDYNMNIVRLQNVTGDYQ